MAKITGLVEIRVNGKTMLVKTGAKATGIGGYKKKPVMGNTYHGTVEEPAAATCEFTLTDRDDISLTELANLEDATVLFEPRGSKKMYVLAESDCEGGFDVTAGEGEVPVVFFGARWEEQF